MQLKHSEGAQSPVSAKQLYKSYPVIEAEILKWKNVYLEYVQVNQADTITTW